MERHQDAHNGEFLHTHLIVRKSHFVACKQQGADQYAHPQSDQRFCLSLSGKYVSLTCNPQNYNCPAGLCSLAGWIEHYMVTNPDYETHSIFEPVHEILVFMVCMHLGKSTTI